MVAAPTSVHGACDAVEARRTLVLPLLRRGGQALVSGLLRRSLRFCGAGPRLWADAAVNVGVDTLAWRWGRLSGAQFKRRTASRVGGCGLGLLAVSGASALGIASAPLSAAVLLVGYAVGEGAAGRVIDRFGD